MTGRRKSGKYLAFYHQRLFILYVFVYKEELNMKKTLKSGYKGYKAYQFLEPGVDYTAFELAAEGNEFGEYIIDLTPEQEADLLATMKKLEYRTVKI